MSFTLQDNTVVGYAADTVFNNSTTLNWYGYQAPTGNSIKSVTFNAVQGFVRFDDLAFVVASVPEPGTMDLAGLGGAALLFWRKRKY
jgi:hypothetical protein